MKTIKKTPRASAIPLYTIGEEIVNSILHGIGVLGATVGLILLCLRTTGIWGGQRAANIDIVAVLVFTATMIFMFLISTLYHAVQHQGAKRILRKLDHSAIYIFIAGTYTPFCLSGIGGAWGWSIFAVQWSLALLGITLNILDRDAFKKIKTAAYIVMGWVILVGLVPLIRSVSVPSLILLFIGGLAYTLGTIWYRKKDVRLTHAVWHFFVIIGAVCHWFSIWFLF